MRIALDAAPAPSRSKPGRSAVPARAPRRGAGFRRSEVARFRNERPAAVPAAPQAPAMQPLTLWGRVAVPGGMLLAWGWFVAANWYQIVQLLG